MWNHGKKPPHNGMIGGHFTRFSGRDNYPQRRGTRPDQQGHGRGPFYTFIAYPCLSFRQTFHGEAANLSDKAHPLPSSTLESSPAPLAATLRLRPRPAPRRPGSVDQPRAQGAIASLTDPPQAGRPSRGG